MAEKAFLTDRRKEILDGATADEMGISDATVRQHRAAVKHQTRAALRELREVAQSGEIDNREVFYPDGVTNLLIWILNDPHQLPKDHGGLAARPNEEIEGVEERHIVRIGEDLKDYQDEIYVRLDGILRSYHQEEQENEDDG